MKIDTIKPIKISEIEKKKKLARLIQNGYVIEYGFTLNPAGEVAVREYPVFKQILKKECPRVNIFVDDQETKSIIEAKKETASIIDIYQLLMYFDGYCLDKVFNHIPVQLAKENKKFQISKVACGAKFKDYWGCIEWLVDARMVNLCYCLHTPDLPLKGNYEDDKYKVYFRDTGLLVANLDEEAQEDLRANKNMNVYKGALYENVIAEALCKQGYELFYYKKVNSTLEQDFFVRTKKSLVPVEVKSTNGRAKSLATLIKSDSYPDITTGIKLIHGNVGFENNIHTFPYFCAFLLKRYLADVEW